MPDTRVFGLTLRFKVTIDGQSLGNWSKCEGLSVEYDIFEYKEGGNNGFVHRIPGRAKYPTLKLTRPLDKSTMDVHRWFATVATQLQPSTAKVAILDSGGTEVATWNLVGVFPSKWSGPTLDVAQNTVATETLELIYDGFGA